MRREDLTDTSWGKEVMQLENLRLLHRIGVAVPNTGTWRQVRVVIMMIDLAAIVNQRLSMNIVEFWKGAREFDELRRAQWVYSPDWIADEKKDGGESESATIRPASNPKAKEEPAYGEPSPGPQASSRVG